MHKTKSKTGGAAAAVAANDGAMVPSSRAPAALALSRVPSRRPERPPGGGHLERVVSRLITCTRSRCGARERGGGQRPDALSHPRRNAGRRRRGKASRDIATSLEFRSLLVPVAGVGAARLVVLQARDHDERGDPGQEVPERDEQEPGVEVGERAGHRLAGADHALERVFDELALQQALDGGDDVDALCGSTAEVLDASNMSFGI